MSTIDLFQHESLDGRRMSFRLLTLFPKDGSKIECELHNTSILDSEPYEALSYTWGSDQMVEPITVNGKTLWITDNLHAVSNDRGTHREKVRPC